VQNSIQGPSNHLEVQSLSRSSLTPEECRSLVYASGSSFMSRRHMLKLSLVGTVGLASPFLLNEFVDNHVEAQIPWAELLEGFLLGLNIVNAVLSLYQNLVGTFQVANTTDEPKSGPVQLTVVKISSRRITEVNSLTTLLSLEPKEAVTYKLIENTSTPIAFQTTGTRVLTVRTALNFRQRQFRVIG